QAALTCSAGIVGLMPNGEIICEHQEDCDFDVTVWVASLIAAGASWREVTWRIWGIMHHFDCLRCGSRFAAQDYEQCQNHSETDIDYSNVLQSGTEMQPCDAATGFLFNPFSAFKGSKRSISHEVAESKSTVWRELQIYRNMPQLAVAAGPPPRDDDTNTPEGFRMFGSWSAEIHQKRDSVWALSRKISSPVVDGRGPLAKLASPSPAVSKGLVMHLQREEGRNWRYLQLLY
ncbi:hypothetical protein HDU82_007869, partial [Entophlyctis luteolus]